MKLLGGLPKGSLEKSCIDLFRQCRYQVRVEERSCYPSIDDEEIELILVRPQEIPKYVAEGKLDFGITGWDCIVEADCEERVVEVGELIFSKVSRKPTVWVVAVNENSPIRQVDDLNGRCISTEMPRMVAKWLNDRIIWPSLIEFSYGATEVKPGRFCDAIVESKESGNSLKRNGLREIAEVLQSTPRFIANPDSFSISYFEKRLKMQDLCRLLRSTLLAESRVMLVMNVEQTNLDDVTEILPSLKGPTIARLSQEGWFSVSAVVEETKVRTIISELLRAGATGIIELPITKVVEDLEIPSEQVPPCPIPVHHHDSGQEPSASQSCLSGLPADTRGYCH